MAAIDATLFATGILGLWTEAGAGGDLFERPPLGYDVFNTPE
jgi:hypothetical protein